VLPSQAIDGLCGQGVDRHAFVTLVRTERLRRAYRLEGIELPDEPVVACLRSTVFDGEHRDSVLLAALDDSGVIAKEQVPVFVSVTSSASAAAPKLAASWMASADLDRLSLVMDTPVTAALRRWCSKGSTFRTETQRVSIAEMEVWVIAGRVEREDQRSALVLIPTTEFGARWFEAICAEDELMRQAVRVDPELFAREAPHLDVVLTHLLLEEHVVGAGSWRV